MSQEQNENTDPTLIYVGKLDPETKAEDLTPFFATYGTVNDVTVRRNGRVDQRQAWAILKFSSPAEAAAAIAGANGAEIQGATIVVEELKRGPRPKRERKPREPAAEDEEAEAPPPGSLHIGNLSWTASEDDLTQLFAQFGQVESVVIARDRRSDRSRGWGSVKMATQEQADAALAAVNGQMLQDRELSVQIKQKASKARKSRGKKAPANEAKEDQKASEPEAPPPGSLHIGNLAWTASEDDLSQLFGQFGQVESVVIARDSRSGRSRGWGSVKMATQDQADAAIASVNGQVLQERELSVQVKQKASKGRKGRKAGGEEEKGEEGSSSSRRRRRLPRNNNNGDNQEDGEQSNKGRNNNRRRRRPRSENGNGEQAAEGAQ